MREQREREREELTVNPVNPLGFSDADAEQKRQRLQGPESNGQNTRERGKQRQTIREREGERERELNKEGGRGGKQAGAVKNVLSGD